MPIAARRRRGNKAHASRADQSEDAPLTALRIG